MLKRFFLTLALAAGLIAPAHAAGTISLSLTQQIDKDTLKPLAAGKLYFFQAGTTTPQNAYSDTALTIPLPNPITLDAAGRLPQFFLADGQIKIRLTNSKGVQQLAADNLLVIGPSSGGGGGGGSVDATTVASTGDWKDRYGTGAIAGWVRANGRTIGSASSGATERANSDAQPLFEYLWNNDGNLAVSGGRGSSANADWIANKTIVLPDQRGRGRFALDDMGNTAAGRLTAAYFGSGITLGNAGGAQSTQLLSAANLPPHTHSGTTGGQSQDHTHFIASPGGTYGAVQTGTGAPNVAYGANPQNTSGASNDHTHSFTTNNGPGTSEPFSNVPPIILVTSYIKL